MNEGPAPADISQEGAQAPAGLPSRSWPAALQSFPHLQAGLMMISKGDREIVSQMLSTLQRPAGPDFWRNGLAASPGSGTVNSTLSPDPSSDL